MSVFVPMPVRWPIQFDTSGTTFHASSGTLVDADGELAGLVFSVPRTGRIKACSWRHYLTQAAGDLEATLETYDESTGRPTGTLFDSNCTAYTFSLLTSDDQKVLTATWAAPCEVTAGDHVCIVFKRPTGSSFTGNIWQGSDYKFSEYSRNNNFPHSFTYVGAVWSLGQGTYHNKSFMLEYDDGVCVCPDTLPVCTTSTGTTFHSGSATNKRGVELWLPDCEVIGLWPCVAFNSGLAGTVNIKLYDATGRVVIAIAPNADIKESTALGQFRWPCPPTRVSPGKYFLMIEPTSTNGCTVYEQTMADIGTVPGAAYASWRGGWAVSGSSFPFARVGAGVINWHTVELSGFYMPDTPPRTRTTRKV